MAAEAGRRYSTAGLDVTGDMQEWVEVEEQNKKQRWEHFEKRKAEVASQRIGFADTPVRCSPRLAPAAHHPPLSHSQSALE